MDALPWKFRKSFVEDFLPNLTAYLHDDGGICPAMLAVPGGGYAMVSPAEGESVTKNKENFMNQILIDGMNFRTSDGKQVLFNGINVVCKDQAQGYFFPNLEKSFKEFRKMGFNLIRFGIFWDGAEPQPGIYDIDYLKKVKDAVLLAAKYDLYVMIDMHQDLFARKYADGAPDWATLDENACHPEGCTMWYDAYLQSEAIIRASDNFWANKTAEDGIGLLDHYEKMWEQIAQYLDECENIIGWEPMNEPFMGSLARNAFGSATMKMKEQYPQFDLADQANITLEQ